MNILDRIISSKRKELNEKKKMFPLKKEQRESVKKNKFLSTITSPHVGDIGLIAEIKMKSPSAGLLGEESQISEKVKQYEAAGADAISVVTDEAFFGGSLALFDAIKSHVHIPVFRKDFIIDEYQLYESALHNADAVLLIARILSSDQLDQYVELSYKLGMEPVVEVYDKEDMVKVAHCEAQAIAVNARDLQTFTIDIEQACALGKQIVTDERKIFIGFSGVSTRAEVELYKKAGAQAILVGTELMKSDEPAEIIRTLKA